MIFRFVKMDMMKMAFIRYLSENGFAKRWLTVSKRSLEVVGKSFNKECYNSHIIDHFGMIMSKPSD